MGIPLWWWAGRMSGVWRDSCVRIHIDIIHIALSIKLSGIKYQNKSLYQRVGLEGRVASPAYFVGRLSPVHTEWHIWMKFWFNCWKQSDSRSTDVTCLIVHSCFSHYSQCSERMMTRKQVRMVLWTIYLDSRRLTMKNVFLLAAVILTCYKLSQHTGGHTQSQGRWRYSWVSAEILHYISVLVCQ